MDLKESGILGPQVETHWYYTSKACALGRMLANLSFRRVLDIGAGSGYFSQYLLRNSAAESACCVDPNYAVERDERSNGKELLFRKSSGSVDADLVLLMDVLEHVADDHALLAEYVAKAPSGSLFFISVPAFAMLWSGHDVFLGHYRRYTLTQLETVVKKSGLQILQGNYYFLAVFPAAASLRLLQRLVGNGQPRHDQEGKSQLTRHGPLMNNFLRWLCRLELPVMRLNRLAGLSVFCLARKP